MNAFQTFIFAVLAVPLVSGLWAMMTGHAHDRTRSTRDENSRPYSWEERYD